MIALHGFATRVTLFPHRQALCPPTINVHAGHAIVIGLVVGTAACGASSIRPLRLDGANRFTPSSLRICGLQKLRSVARYPRLVRLRSEVQGAFHRFSRR